MFNMAVRATRPNHVGNLLDNPPTRPSSVALTRTVTCPKRLVTAVVNTAVDTLPRQYP